MKTAADTGQQILDTALKLADSYPWETIRLHDIAQVMGCSLDTIRQHYPEKEALIDAWFDRADQRMLKETEDADFQLLSPQEKLERVIMAWLDALAPHQTATRHMILGKLEPGHLHIQLAGLLRVSRTVQWMREAAQRDATYMNRAIEESTLTAIYLLCFARWLSDESVEFEQTQQLLHRLLNRFSVLLYVTGGHIVTPPPQRAATTRRTGNPSRTQH